MRPSKVLNRMMLMTCAPFVGVLAFLYISLSASGLVVMTSESFPKLNAAVSEPSQGLWDSAVQGLGSAEDKMRTTQEAIDKQIELYSNISKETFDIAKLAASQVSIPYTIYDKRISAKLGTPSASINTGRLQAQLYHLETTNFTSYAVKLKLKSSSAADMVLADGDLGSSETTLAAAKRVGATIAINAGGFADQDGKRYPLSTTMVDGEYVKGFEASFSDLFFVGLNENNRLIGGKFNKQEDLDALKPRFGASFVPVLMRNGVLQQIPDKWQTNPERAPRTVIANYRDDQLLFIIADGYKKGGSKGATLAEMQILLKRFGTRNGYNLDGGGSTSLVWEGRVVNNPSDGQLRKLPTHFVFYK